MYFESILQDTLRVTVRFVDSGDSTKEGKTVREGLPLVGQERVEIEFEDNNEIAIGADPKLVLYVNKITPVENDTNIELTRIVQQAIQHVNAEKSVSRKLFDINGNRVGQIKTYVDLEQFDND